MNTIINSSTAQVSSVSGGIVRSSSSPNVSEPVKTETSENKLVKDLKQQADGKLLSPAVDKLNPATLNPKVADRAEKLKEEEKEKELSSEKLDNVVSDLNANIQSVQRNLEFSVDKDLEQIVVNIKDKKTDEVIRQIPSEEFLELARNLQSMNDMKNGHSEGVLFNDKV